MGAPNAIIADAQGLQEQQNELTLPPGSLTVCENMEITRDGIVEVARGFDDFSTNLPDFEPQQLISVGGVLYAHHDNGLWYYDTDSEMWLRKRGSLGTRATLPTSLTYSSGHLYYGSNGVVWDIDTSSGTRSVLAGRFGSGGISDGVGDAARFDSSPISMRGMCVDSGNLYVSDTGNFTIRKIVLATATVSTLAGSAGAIGTSDGTGAAARFSSPKGICSDGSGNLYVCDNESVRKIVVSSGAVTTVAGQIGSPGYADATGTAAQFHAPEGITYNTGFLYIADSANHVVRKADTTAFAVTTFAGGAPGGTADGVGTAAAFRGPFGICNDGTYLYLCEAGSQSRIRQILISSALVSAIGGTINSTGSADGIAGTGLLSVPYDICVGASRTLYVADRGNSLVRICYPSTTYLGTLVGSSTLDAFSTGSRLADGIVVGPS